LLGSDSLSFDLALAQHYERIVTIVERDHALQVWRHLSLRKLNSWALTWAPDGHRSDDREPAALCCTTSRACFLGLALAGCTSEPYGHIVANHTNEAIEIIELSDAAERDLGSVKPGLELPLNFYFGLDNCSTGILVVRSGGRAGPEVARRTEPLCYRDRWVVSKVAPSN